MLLITRLFTSISNTVSSFQKVNSTFRIRIVHSREDKSIAITREVNLERDFMQSLTKEKQYDLIDALNSTSRYLDDLLNIESDNIHFELMVHRIYPAELQLNKANASDTEAAFLDLNLSIHNDIVSTKIYYKRVDFNFDIVNFPFLDGDVPQRPSYGVYMSQLIRFARASLHVTDFNNRNKFLTVKLLVS